MRDSRVFKDEYVREHTSLEKGEIAEERSNPKLFSGTMQKMQRTVTFGGELSANKRNDNATDMLMRIRGFLMHD